MFDFNKLCNLYGNLSVAEKQNLLNVKAKGIIDSLCTVKTTVKNPTSSLAGFIIGLSALDGVINERQYLLIYPTLTHIFGEKRIYHQSKKISEIPKPGKTPFIVTQKMCRSCFPKTTTS